MIRILETIEIICLQGLLSSIFNLYPFCSHDNMKTMNSLRVTENLLEVLSEQRSQSKKGEYKEEKNELEVYYWGDGSRYPVSDQGYR